MEYQYSFWGEDIMRTYSVEGITIHIGAEVLCVHIDGKTVTPKEQKKDGLVKGFLKELWRNNYFRRQTKKFLGVKTAEVAMRTFGAVQLYWLGMPYVEPYLPEIKMFLANVDWESIIMHVDFGFGLGIFATSMGIYLKRRFFEWLNWEGDRQHEKV